MAKIKGNVKYFDIRRGFGFIAGDDGNDYYCNFKGIENGRHYKGFEAGDGVEFETAEGKKGPMATKINMVKPISNTKESSTDEQNTTAETPAE